MLVGLQLTFPPLTSSKFACKSGRKTAFSCVLLFTFYLTRKAPLAPTWTAYTVQHCHFNSKENVPVLHCTLPTKSTSSSATLLHFTAPHNFNFASWGLVFQRQHVPVVFKKYSLAKLAWTCCGRFKSSEKWMPSTLNVCSLDDDSLLSVCFYHSYRSSYQFAQILICRSLRYTSYLA